MKKNKFKDNKYRCYYCNTLNFITAYLVKDKCPICNKKLSVIVKLNMKLQLSKGFCKKRYKYYKNRLKRNEEITNNQPIKRR